MLMDVGVLTLLTVFLAGMASFLSPCVLPIVPGYVSYFSGHTKQGTTEQRIPRLRILALSCAFVFGFSIVFIAMGASLSLLGQVLLSYRYELNIVAGVIVVLAGLSVLGLLRLPMRLQQYYVFQPSDKEVGLGRAVVIGLAFGFGWTPCIGPVLAGILMMGASTASAGTATVLLGVYALGLGVPFVLAAYFMTPFMQRMARIKRVGVYVRWFSGVVLVIMGIAMATGELARFAIWIYNTFPALGKLG